MTATLAATPPAALGRGILFALGSYASFATADALIKLHSERFSTFQIALIIACFALLPAVALAKGRGGVRAFLPRRWNLVIARAVLTSTCCVLAWTAFGLLPLAESYALLFMAPLLVTALSALVLGEAAGWRRWLSTLVGFAGVLIMLDPQFDNWNQGHLFAACAAVLGAGSFLILRKIGDAETSASILTTLLVALIVVSAVPALQYWVAPATGEWIALVLAGLLFGSGQAGLVFATRDAPAALVAPFQYTQMAWAVAFGITIFGDHPSLNLLFGLAIVVASGLFSIWRETVRSRTITMATGRGEILSRVARRRRVR